MTVEFFNIDWILTLIHFIIGIIIWIFWTHIGMNKEDLSTQWKSLSIAMLGMGLIYKSSEIYFTLQCGNPVFSLDFSIILFIVYYFIGRKYIIKKSIEDKIDNIGM